MPIISGEQFFRGKPGTIVQSVPKSFPVEEKQPNYLQRVGTGLKETFTGLGKNIQTQQKAFAQPFAKGGAPVKQVEAVARGGLRTVGALAEAAFTPVLEAPGIKQATEFVGEKLAETPPMQKYAEWSQKYPDAAKDIENVLDISSVIPGAKVAQTGIKAGMEGAKTTIAGAKAGVQTGKQLVKGAGKAVEPIVQEAKRMPARFQTNIAQKGVIQESINKLPTQTARQAAQDGIDVVDIKTIYSIPKTQKASLRKLAIVVKKFASGETKTNPIEVVGKPIISRIKQLESQRGTIGQKLGKAAENLGEVNSQKLFVAVFNSLKKVPGLSGLKVDAKGILDFSDTTLASNLSRAEQIAIQKIYTPAIRAGTGKSKHLLRQELFEILGGKKKSLANLTDTQEKAFNAVRSGLSDVLESKNPVYKNLSNQYRKIAQPLQEIRSYMKKVAGADEDILDMSAGLLARRLTSAAKSNPEIRSVLNAMDKATAVAGKTRLSVETLQDFYNILEKYYDIPPKTGFQNQVRQGVEKAISGPAQFIGDQFKSYLGETPVVRQKALERILEEALK